MLSGLLDRLRRILPLAKKAADEIFCDETDILEIILPRTFDVMHRVAEFLCDYVRRGRHSFYSGLAYREKIEEMDTKLTEVNEDLGRAMDALRFAKETGKHLLPQPGNITFSAVSSRATAVA